MVNEHDRILEAVKFSIQMEIDGKEYYLKISQESSDELGEKLLRNMSAEEDIHRRKFVQIYEAIRNEKAWPAVVLQPDGSKRLRTVFAQALEKVGSRAKALSTELEVIQTAMRMESKSYDFYREQGKKTDYDAEKDFYRKLATEEREHHQLLGNYYEYLKDPAGYFVQKEHPSLDGG